jgi:uncharacterized protein involved in exopolysaccharide biosynthesis
MSSLKSSLLAGLLAATLMAIFSLFLQDQYLSQVRILPSDSKSVSGGFSGLAAAAAAFGVNVPGGDGNDANFVDILQSRYLKERLLQTEFQFTVKPWRFGAEETRRETLLAFLKVPNSERGQIKLTNVMTTTRDPRSKIISINVETCSPSLSQQVAARAVSLLEEFVQQKGRTRGGAKAIFAEARLKDARRDMDEAEGDLRRFLDGNRNFLTSQDPAVRLRGARLEAELKMRQQLVLTLAVNREQSLIEEKNDQPTLSILDPPNLPIERSRPARTALVLTALLVVGIFSGVWQNRISLKTFLLDDEAKLAQQ